MLTFTSFIPFTDPSDSRFSPEWGSLAPDITGSVVGALVRVTPGGSCPFLHVLLLGRCLNGGDQLSQFARDRAPLMLKPRKSQTNWDELVLMGRKGIQLLCWRRLGTATYAFCPPSAGIAAKSHCPWAAVGSEPTTLSFSSLPHTLACAASAPNFPSHTAPARHSDDSPQRGQPKACPSVSSEQANSRPRCQGY